MSTKRPNNMPTGSLPKKMKGDDYKIIYDKDVIAALPEPKRKYRELEENQEDSFERKYKHQERKYKKREGSTERKSSTQREKKSKNQQGSSERKSKHSLDAKSKPGTLQSRKSSTPERKSSTHQARKSKFQIEGSSDSEQSLSEAPITSFSDYISSVKRQNTIDETNAATLKINSIDETETAVAILKKSQENFDNNYQMPIQKEAVEENPKECLGLSLLQQIANEAISDLPYIHTDNISEPCSPMDVSVQEPYEPYVEKADQVQEAVEESKEKAVEESKEKSIEESVQEKSIEESAKEKSIEKSIEEKSIEKSIEESAKEKSIEKSIEESAKEKSIEKSIEESVEESIEKSIEKSKEESIEESAKEKSIVDENQTSTLKIHKNFVVKSPGKKFPTIQQRFRIQSPSKNLNSPEVQEHFKNTNIDGDDESEVETETNNEIIQDLISKPEQLLPLVVNMMANDYQTDMSNEKNMMVENYSNEKNIMAENYTTEKNMVENYTSEKNMMVGNYQSNMPNEIISRFSPAYNQNETYSTPSVENQTSKTPYCTPSRENQIFSTPSRENQIFSTPSRENQIFSTPSRENQIFSTPSRENQIFSTPSRENQGEINQQVSSDKNEQTEKTEPKVLPQLVGKIDQNRYKLTLPKLHEVWYVDQAKKMFNVNAHKKIKTELLRILKRPMIYLNCGGFNELGEYLLDNDYTITEKCDVLVHSGLPKKWLPFVTELLTNDTDHVGYIKLCTICNYYSKHYDIPRLYCSFELVE